MIRCLMFCAALLALTGSARAEFRFGGSDFQQAYVESNLLGIFYHELGHALVDILELPIFGQEEDAADVLSVFLIDAFYDEETAVQLAYDTAFGFLSEAETSDGPVFWDVHGPDLQRYYNLVCIFYGANPDERDDVAADLGLPEERADYCPEEYDQAAGSWGAALDSIHDPAGGNTLRMATINESTDAGKLTTYVISEEVAALNKEFRLPQELMISVQPCGEANAFYDPEQREITMCTEFTDFLSDNYVD